MAANEPRSYREAFVWVFEAVRPHVETIAVDPDLGLDDLLSITDWIEKLAQPGRPVVA